MTPRYVILYTASSDHSDLPDRLRARLAGRAEIHCIPSLNDLDPALRKLREDDTRIIAVISSASDALPHIPEPLQTSVHLIRLGAQPATTAHHAQEKLIYLPLQPSDDQLQCALEAIFTQEILQHAPENAQAFADLLDRHQLANTVAQASQARQRMRQQFDDLREVFVSSSDPSNEQSEQTLINYIDRRWNTHKRLTIASGQMLFHENEPVVGIWIILSGQVHLTRQFAGHEVVFHLRSVGRILGLMALAQRRHAFFSCRALTDVSAIYITWEELDELLKQEPMLTVHFMTMLVRSLAIRLRKIVDLQLQVEQLNEAIARERDQLKNAMNQLRMTQNKLIQTEKMSTLGQLVAGIAHELNNPITAIQRASEHLYSDVTTLLKNHPCGDDLAGYLDTIIHSTPLPTAELRKKRDAMAARLKNPALAQQLLQMGITDAATSERLLPSNLDSNTLNQRKLYLKQTYQLGTAIRNLRSASTRVTSIVRSLRGHARQETGEYSTVNLHEGLDDTLLLFTHRTHNVHVERQYDNIPPIQCNAGQISQVWTNIISNALDAMKDTGDLMIRTDQPDGGHVRIRISDSGPGIPPEYRDRLFDLNFTTKHGGAAFGLGIGLLICKQIITAHDGTITLDRSDNRTVATVTLPIRQSGKTTVNKDSISQAQGAAL